MGAVAGQERTAAAAPSHDGARHLGPGDGQQGQSDHAGSRSETPTPQA